MKVLTSIASEKKLFAKVSIIQFVKFNIIGIINTGLNYVIYSILVFFGSSKELALGIDYAVGIIISYVLNKKFTFKNDNKDHAFMVIKMIVTYIVIFFINLGLLKLFVDIWLFNKYIGQFFAICFIAVISFLMQKLFVFKA